MKSIQLIAVALMFATACTKENDEINPASSGQTQNHGSAKVTQPLPFTIYLSSTADAASTPTPCSGDLPGFAIGDLFLNGTATHTGDLISAQSRLHHDNCNLSFATALLTTGVSGQLMAANGDLIYFTGDDVINVFNLLTQSGTTGAIQGEWHISGGTGRFSDATGSLTFNGQVDFTTSTFSGTGIGTIIY